MGASGELAALEGSFSEAVSLLGEGEQMLEEVGHRVELSKLHCRKARVLIGAGRVQEARVLLERVRIDADELGARSESPLGIAIRDIEEQLAAEISDEV